MVLRASGVKALKNMHEGTFRRSVNERKVELGLEVLAGDWELTPMHLAMLGPSDEAMREALLTDPDLFEKLLDEAVEAFVDFRTAFFQTPQGKAYTMKAFHQKWIKDILRAILTGARHVILSPPRTGKTDLAIHFGVWEIIRNPNVRILWVAASAEMASKAVDSVRSHLEDNEKLRNAYLPPGLTWKPPSQRGGGTSWSKSEFTVATRTVVGSKSPTMVGVGSGGKILSRDTDIIWLDDLEDSTTVSQPGRRETTRTWLDITIESRKEQDTSLVMIGSRQHPDDIYAHLIDKTTWTHVVETAHDEDCIIPEDDVKAHVECMIFPERLSYSFLQEKKETLGSESFDMQYLGLALPSEGAIFPNEMIEACLNRERGIGMFEVPKGLDLIAGLDPAVGPNQAAVLWGVHKESGMIYLIDLSYGGDGGVDGAKRLMVEWYDTYKLDYWVIEKNGFQNALYLSEQVKEWARSRNITLKPHATTGQTKWDPNFGVGSMRPAFKDLRIDLPFGTHEAIKKVKPYRRQLVTFTETTAASRKKNVKSDLVMAGWFPWKIIQRKVVGDVGDLTLVEDSKGSSYPGGATSYPGQTKYPGQTQYPG